MEQPLSMTDVFETIKALEADVTNDSYFSGFEDAKRAILQIVCGAESGGVPLYDFATGHCKKCGADLSTARSAGRLL